MELRHLRYFVMAAEESNISRAASRLSVSQPAVSRQIQDLEDDLGVRLFDRNHNGLTLTDAGGAALAHAREILRQAAVMEDAMARLANQSSALSIKVGFIPTALPGFLAEGMRKFHEKHADICVQIFEMSPRDQEKALRAGEIDLGLIGDPSAEIRREFEVETIRKTEMALVVPDSHRFASRRVIDLAALGEDRFLSLHEKHFPTRPQLMADLFARAGIDPEVTLRANGLTELLGLVGSGAGVALAPADLAQLPHAGVVFIRLKKPKLTLRFSGAWPKNEKGPIVEVLVAMMQEE